jgi:hypothetical protein
LPDWKISSEQVPAAALHTRFVYYEDDPGTWNTLEIICNGMLVQTVVNGNLVADFRGDGILNDDIHKSKGVGTNGCIALQLHQNDELLITYKEILIKDL